MCVLRTIDLISVCLQKFGQGLILELCGILLYILLTMKHICMNPKFCIQTLHITLTTAKTTLCTKFVAKIVIFCVCFQTFGKNAMLKLHVMLLSNHSITVHTCMTSKSGKSSPKSAHSMHMRTTCPKRVWSGQSENEFSTVFKTKNVLVFFKIKKKHGDSAGLPMSVEIQSHGPSQVLTIWLYKFFWGSIYMSRSLRKNFVKKNSHLKSLLGLMCKTKQSKICRIYVIM